jgi:hypothetical protein
MGVGDGPCLPLRIIIDLDADLLPLREWLRILKVARVQYEVSRSNQSQAAKTLGISRQCVHETIKFEVKYGKLTKEI